MKKFNNKQNHDARDESNYTDGLLSESYEEFSDMNIRRDLIRGIFKYGFVKPSEIQKRGIMPLVYGKDMIAQAQSGTGKTATFVIGTLHNVNDKLHKVQIMITVPTRELAYQIQLVVRAIGKYMKIIVQSFIGGTYIKNDLFKFIKKVPHIVVGTPGRLIDVMSISNQISNNLEYLIIDEADEMFSQGFKIQIYKIFKFLPYHCSIALFSATLPKDILRVIALFIEKPVKILIKKEELTLEGIKQFYIPVDKEEWKIEALYDIYKSIPVEQSIIYVNTTKRAEWLGNAMKQADFPIGYLHGDMEQSNRTAILKNFRSGKFRFLIATDLLSRGIDIKKVNFVLNFDLPSIKENYIHRIGRSGRFGKKGIAINFLTRQDINILREIESYYNTTIELLPKDLSNFDF